MDTVIENAYFSSPVTLGPSIQHISTENRGELGSISTSRTSTTMKKEFGNPETSLKNELKIYCRLFKTLNILKLKNWGCQDGIHTFNIPYYCRFMKQNVPEWQPLLPLLPSDSTSSNALIAIVEKILPMPKSARKLIVEKYGPFQGDSDAERNIEVLVDPMKQHSLFHPYLGHRQASASASVGNLSRRRNPDGHPFSLRNFSLRIDRMEELGIERSIVIRYARGMAEALAFLHWAVHVDGAGISFVLAPPRTGQSPCLDWEEFGPHTIWMLNFDRCKRKAFGESGIEDAVKAFWSNEPFYPRPGSDNTSDQLLWLIFRGVYLERSRRFLHSRSSRINRLPAILLDRIEETKGVYGRAPVSGRIRSPRMFF